MQIVADSTDDDFPRVESHSDAHLDAMCTSYLVSIRLHGGLHRPARIASTRGMILVRHRGAEDGHHTITEHLIHRAFKAVHRVHHDVNGRVEELLGGFRVEVPNQLGGVFDVTEHHRDLLALAFQGTAGGKDFLGQVLGRV
jgi:hypothetical protein